MKPHFRPQKMARHKDRIRGGLLGGLPTKQHFKRVVSVYLEDIKLSQPKRLVISLEGADTLKFSR